MALQIVQSNDGSCTAYSAMFDEHYHSTKDGALSETLHKHVIPAFEQKKNHKELHILDICFGLGLNTFATIEYYSKHSPDTRLYIYSPEFDRTLIRELPAFGYPPELAHRKHIIDTLSAKQHYNDTHIQIELFVGDAREYIKSFSNRFDIVYQDAFSPKTNPLLWTREYFADIKAAMRHDGILTTYSTALAVRLALHHNGFLLYLLKHKELRNSTVASLVPCEGLTPVDMRHKIACNPDAKPLSDTQIAQKNHNIRL